MAFLLLFNFQIAPSYAETVTWSVESKKDVTYDGDNYNARYDLEYVSAQIFDNHPDEIYFYMDFHAHPSKRGCFLYGN